MVSKTGLVKLQTLACFFKTISLNLIKLLYNYGKDQQNYINILVIKEYFG